MTLNCEASVLDLRRVTSHPIYVNPVTVLLMNQKDLIENYLGYKYLKLNNCKLVVSRIVIWSYNSLQMIIIINYLKYLKLFVLDRNTWNYITMCQLFVLDRNTWNYITICQLFVFDWNHVNCMQTNDYYQIRIVTWNNVIIYKLWVLWIITWSYTNLKRTFIVLCNDQRKSVKNNQLNISLVMFIFTCIVPIKNLELFLFGSAFWYAISISMCSA